VKSIHKTFTSRFNLSFTCGSGQVGGYADVINTIGRYLQTVVCKLIGTTLIVFVSGLFRTWRIESVFTRDGGGSGM